MDQEFKPGDMVIVHRCKSLTCHTIECEKHCLNIPREIKKVVKREGMITNYLVAQSPGKHDVACVYFPGDDLVPIEPLEFRPGGMIYPEDEMAW